MTHSTPQPVSAIQDPEQAFRAYTDRSTNYFAAVAARGGQPWHEDDVDRRRALFMQRFTRPQPPEGLYKNLDDIRGRTFVDTPGEGEHAA